MKQHAAHLTLFLLHEGTETLISGHSSGISRGPVINVISRSRKNVSRANSYLVQGSSLGCGRREIPGVTQVEKGHADNTAATAYVGET